MNKYMGAAFVAAVIMISCKKEGAPSVSPPETSIAPDGFNFSTSKNITVNVRLLTPGNEALKHIKVNFYNPADAKGGKALYTAISDENGYIKATINLPAYLDTLLIDAAYIGLLRNAKAVINGNNIDCIIGGENVYSGDVAPNDNAAGDMLVQSSINISDIIGGDAINYTYLSTYDVTGRPTKLETSDAISAELLSFINTSLPESRPVPVYHPDFLVNDAATVLQITATSDVFITFVHEGAGYYNSLGYYTYPTGHAPQAISDITDIKIAIPNASLLGSGGNMHSGDKIKLGRFEAGTSIGFVLLQNAWNGSAVNTNVPAFFSNDVLNPEKAPYKRHTVLLYDDKDKLFLQGFEDLNRDNGAGDNDFNDLIFYATSNPVDGISTEHVNPIDKPIDTDGDGVTDTYDDFPNDPTRAYINYFPAKDKWGTLAFEDLWPATGDYDLNDLVVGYRYTFINDANNKTIEVYGDYAARATGASFINGFGVQFPFEYGKINIVTGQKFLGTYIKRNSNGTEAGQKKAVIIPFDDTRALISQGGFANTGTGNTYFASDTVHVYIKFNAAISAGDIGTAPFNPFLISNQRRGYEVHLPGTAGTDKADASLYGTGDDKTNTLTGKFYLSADNWPWAINISDTFDYPSETNSIAKAYPNFLTWAKSGGLLSTDWFLNISGNRNTQYIYSK